MSALFLRKIGSAASLCVAACLILAGSARAQWKEVVTIVVPYGPGGGNDGVARILAQELTGKLATSVIVENKPGGGGVPAVNAVKNAAPDGRTLLLNASITEIQSSKEKPLYDVSKDLAPVILGFQTSYLLMTNLSVPITSISELIKYAQQNPGKLSYASFGAGSAPHLAFELLKQRANLTAVHIPYRSGAESLNAVLTNQVQLSLDSYAFVGQHIQAGTIRAIATTGLEREKKFPNIPTVDESGIPGYNVIYTGGIMAPKDTPKEIIEVINAAINKVLLKPETVQAVDRVGFSVVGGTSDRYRETLNKNIEATRKLISSAGITF